MTHQANKNAIASARNGHCSFKTYSNLPRNRSHSFGTAPDRKQLLNNGIVDHVMVTARCLFVKTNAPSAKKISKEISKAPVYVSGSKETGYGGIRHDHIESDPHGPLSLL